MSTSTPEPDDYYEVTLSHTISTTVRVPTTAGTPQDVAALVMRHDYPLPPRTEWNAQKDWNVVIDDANGETLYES